MLYPNGGHSKLITRFNCIEFRRNRLSRNNKHSLRSNAVRQTVLPGSGVVIAAATSRNTAREPPSVSRPSPLGPVGGAPPGGETRRKQVSLL